MHVRSKPDATYRDVSICVWKRVVRALILAKYPLIRAHRDASFFFMRTRHIDRVFARLVLKIQKLHVVVSLLKDYTIFLLYITMFIIVNYILLLVKTIQI